MAAFGLGTLPALLATGLAAERLSAFVRLRTTRRLAGALLMVFGLWIVVGSLGMELGHGGGHGTPIEHAEHAAQHTGP